MERLNSTKPARAGKTRLALACLGLGISSILASCGEQSSVEPDTSVDQGDIRAHGAVTYVRPGESRFVRVLTDGEDNKELVDKLPLVDHLYPNGARDESAPHIDETPQRLRAIVHLTGRSHKLNQDAACDTIGVARPDETLAIGALALGGDADAVFISWPEQSDGSNGDYFYMCMFQDVEPKDRGVVVFAQTQQQ